MCLSCIKIKDTKLFIMTWKLQLYHLDTKAVGWCLNEKKMDQNEGSQVLNGKFEEIQCLRTCLDIQQKSIHQRMQITGCEHNTYSRSCQFHTRSVSGGSGTKGYTCWTLNSGKKMDRKYKK